MTELRFSPFNTALETGLRTLAVLVASYPRLHDLGRLVQYDYLVVHSADAGGPPSLHPPLPLRSGELLVRRELVQSGVKLMQSRFLVAVRPSEHGILYSADESAGAFLDNLKCTYALELRDRAAWVAETFDHLSDGQLSARVNRLFEAWTMEFQPAEGLWQGDLW